MNINPYKSPEYGPGGSGVGALALRLFAVACWFFSLLPILGFLSIANRPDVADKWEQNAFLFICLMLAMFALPSAGFAALGAASWWRSRWMAILGIAAFLPIVVWSLAAAYWPR